MEFFAELLLALIEGVAELVLQFVAEALFELGLRWVERTWVRPKPWHPALASIGYVLLGATAGAISLWIFPHHFINTTGARLANLLLTPLLSGAGMAALGAWRRKRDQQLIRLDRFAYGYLFALAMAIVRYAWGQ